MSILHLLNKQAEWTRDQPIKDRGRFKDNFVPIDPALPIRIQIAGYKEKLLAEQFRTEMTHVAFTEPEVDMRRDDRLLCDGVLYFVLAKMPPSIPEHHMKWALRAEQIGEVVNG